MRSQKNTGLYIHKNTGFIPRHIILTLQNYTTTSQRQFLNKLTDKKELLSTFRKISRWQVINLDLWFSNNQILKSIRDIHLSRLRIINFCFDSIESLEAISRLRAPQLQVIWLKNNKLISISPMKKIMSKKITQIWINNNHINSIEAFSQINWIYPKYIGIETYVTEHQCQNLSSIAKIKNHKNQQFELSANSTQRIAQNFFRQSLQRKYPSKRAIILLRK